MISMLWSVHPCCWANKWFPCWRYYSTLEAWFELKSYLTMSHITKLPILYDNSLVSLSQWDIRYNRHVPPSQAASRSGCDTATRSHGGHSGVCLWFHQAHCGTFQKQKQFSAHTCYVFDGSCIELHRGDRARQQVRHTNNIESESGQFLK